MKTHGGWRQPRRVMWTFFPARRPCTTCARDPVLWDDTNLYIGIRVEEPHVHAKYTNRNDLIYDDNDIEIFIAGRDAYYEFELNAFNTPYEVFFIWDEAYEKSGFSKASRSSLRSKLKEFNGVGFKTHPRGGRLGNFDWSFPGKRTAVRFDGTVNNDSDTDKAVGLWNWHFLGRNEVARHGRSRTAAEEWRSMAHGFLALRTPTRNRPPQRIQAAGSGHATASEEPHIPECFALVEFSTNNVRSPRQTR